MRVTSVDLYSANFSEPISLNLRDIDPTNQYMVRNIVGLDTEEIVPKFYGFGLVTKPRFYDFGMKARDIVMSIVLNPRFRLDESVSDIRDDLYRAISATRTGMIALHFKSGGTIVARISGFIIKFEVPYFAKLPEVQITVRCDDPMFRALNPVIFKPPELVTVNPLVIPDSLSTAPHGFSMKITILNTMPWFQIQDVAGSPEWLFKVVPSGGFLTNDVLYFSSDYSNRYLYMVRSGITTHLMDRIQPDSIWPTIFPGRNEFFIWDVPFKVRFDLVQYYAAYWGV